MRMFVVTMLVIAILRSTADADARLDVVAANEWTGRIEKRDIRGMRAWMTFPLHVDGLWFDAPACTRFSGKPLDIGASELPALVKCIAESGKIRQEFNDHYDFTYGPALGWVVVDKGKVRELHGGFLGGVLLLGEVPFTLHMTDSSLPHFVAPDPGTLQQIQTLGLAAEVAVQICVDKTGALTGVTGRAKGTTPRTYVPTAEAAVRRSWPSRQILVHDKPMAVCAEWRIMWPPPS
jgi:hypothetical protein